MQSYAEMAAMSCRPDNNFFEIQYMHDPRWMRAEMRTKLNLQHTRNKIAAPQVLHNQPY